MNNARHGPVRVALALIIWSAVPAVHAQDPSLTKEFPNLSPKERSRIAAREVVDAQQDQAYQAMMTEAEQAFQQGRYEDALASYEKARVQRPYNVYPKVKIQDLKALLKRKEEERAAGGGEPAQTVVTSAAPVVAVPLSELPAVSAPIKPVPSPPPTTGRPVQATPPARPKQMVPRTEARPAPPEGMEERRYRDGQAFVIERTISVEGRRVVYKRVAHPHGQVFFFEDGISVSERVWDARFP